MILSQGAVLEPPLEEIAGIEDDSEAAPVTLRDAERAHIRRTLRQTGGVISVAAARLGLPRSTLFYKMRRLGIIARREQKPGSRNRGGPAGARTLPPT